MKIGYARVSTVDQSLELQIDALEKYGCERIFQEKISGAKDEREQLQRALDTLRPGDQFVVYKLDRLARSTKKLISITEQLREMSVEFVSIQDNIDTSTPAGKFMFHMLAILAEFERDIIIERTKAGLAAARARGRKGGKPKKSQKAVQHAIELYDSKKLTIKEIHKLTGVSSSTLYRYLQQRKDTL